MNIIEEVKSCFDEDITVKISKHDDYSNELFIYKDDVELIFDWKDEEIAETVEEVKYFFDYIYQADVGIINQDYVEIPITVPNPLFMELLNGKKVSDKLGDNNIYYEISEASTHFHYLIRLHHKKLLDYGPDDWLTTLKIYNINNIIKTNYKNKTFIEKSINLAKTILFDLHKDNDILLKLINLDKIVNQDYSSSNPYEKIRNNLKDIKEQKVQTVYEDDLVNYYLRATYMDDSQFKYLAYYQVLECIFEEVYLNETIDSIKQIITSKWFNKYKNEDIKKVIELVEKYNNSKHDREKLRLVLEKFFKGKIHSESFYLANKDIIKLLKNMGLIKKDKDLNDLQNLSNIIYDYRCDCTHSNRGFSFRTSFDNTTEELNNYIKLVKKISERIIMNYKT